LEHQIIKTSLEAAKPKGLNRIAKFWVVRSPLKQEWTQMLRKGRQFPCSISNAGRVTHVEIRWRVIFDGKWWTRRAGLWLRLTSHISSRLWDRYSVALTKSWWRQ